MKNSKYILVKLVLFIFIPFFVSSCSVDDVFTQRDKTFTGKDQVEFKPVTNTVDERGDASDDPAVISPLLQLISSKGTLDSDVTIEYAVDDSSTAVAGTDYNIMDSSPLTIASGNVSVKLNIEIMADELNDGESRILYISQKNINGGNIISSANFITYTLIIRGATD